MTFNEQLHPRGSGAKGGQFVAKGESGERDAVGYDARKGTGAGYGTRHGDARVKELQRLLNGLGMKDAAGNPLKVDGKLGPRTTSAIKRLQRRLGLAADGKVSPALLKKIRTLKSAPAHSPAAKKAAAAPSRKTTGDAGQRRDHLDRTLLQLVGAGYSDADIRAALEAAHHTRKPKSKPRNDVIVKSSR